MTRRRQELPSIKFTSTYNLVPIQVIFKSLTSKLCESDPHTLRALMANSYSYIARPKIGAVVQELLVVEDPR